MNTENNMITVEPIDIREINEYSGQIQPLKDYGLNIHIKSQADYDTAVEFLKQVKGKSKELEIKRKGITTPIDTAKKAVMDLFRPTQDALTDIERSVKKEMIRYTNEQDRIRREKEEKLREQARREEERKRKQLEARAQKAEEKGKDEKAEELREQAEQVSIVAPILPSQPKTEGIKYVEKWRAEIVNIKEIPREYLIPDMQALNKIAAATKGKLQIPGIIFKSEKMVSSRSF